MNGPWLNTAVMTAVFLALFASAELLYHKFRLKAETTRKYVHFTTGVLTMSFPIYIRNPWAVTALCTGFFVLLWVSSKADLLPSINKVGRLSRGSLLYPVVVCSCYWIYSASQGLIYYALPVLLLAVCDPAAALVDQKWPLGAYVFFGHTKTVLGSAVFFLMAWILAFLLLHFVSGAEWMRSVVIGLVTGLATTISEAFTHRGYDNLTIPVSALFMLYIFRHVL